MQLLRSKIVPSAQDAYWEQIPERWRALQKATVLAITYPYEKQTEEETTLNRLLAACGYTAGNDCEVISITDGETVAWHSIQDHFNPKYVLLFGVSTADIGISAMFAPYSVNSFGSSGFIPAPSLIQLSGDAAAKKALWEGALKPTFTKPSKA